MRNLFFVAALMYATPAFSADCSSPEPIYGKVVAICGNQMIAYVGDETVSVLGVRSTFSRFELSYCSNGGGRKELQLETNSEGWKFRFDSGIQRESYTISMMGGSFSLRAIDYYGQPVVSPCSFYDDKRPVIRWLLTPPKS